MVTTISGNGLLAELNSSTTDYIRDVLLLQALSKPLHMNDAHIEFRCEDTATAEAAVAVLKALNEKHELTTTVAQIGGSSAVRLQGAKAQGWLTDRCIELAQMDATTLLKELGSDAASAVSLGRQAWVDSGRNIERNTSDTTTTSRFA